MLTVNPKQAFVKRFITKCIISSVECVTRPVVVDIMEMGNKQGNKYRKHMEIYIYIVLIEPPVYVIFGIQGGAFIRGGH